MTWWDITAEVVDWILRAGGLLAGAALLIQTYLKAWISDHFTTKKDFRALSNEMEKISASATSNLRVAAVTKLIELRFQAVGELQICCSQYFKGLTSVISAIANYHRFKVEAEQLGEMHVLEQRLSETRTEFYDLASKFRAATLLHRPHVPTNLIMIAMRVWDVGGEIFEGHDNLTSAPKIEDMNPVSEAIVEFGEAVEKALLSAPDLANEVYPERPNFT